MIPTTAPMPLLKFVTVQRVPASGSTQGRRAMASTGGCGGAIGWVTLIVTWRNWVEPSVSCTRIS